MSVLGLNEPFRPAPKRNNLWLKVVNQNPVLVFVHGVLSDSHGCWYHEPSDQRPGVYWPDLVQKDPRFAHYSIYLGGYSTGVKSGAYEVSDCAQELFEALDRPGEGQSPSVLNRRTIIFVCHSMGGIVTRYMLTARPWAFMAKRVGLALIASPSYGSAWADRLDLLLKYFRNEQGKKLKWGNWSLKDLDDRFQLMLEAKAIPELIGREACENHFVVRASWLPAAEPLVPGDSAGRYFGRVRMLRDTDHFTCVKPDGRDHPAYQFLSDFCHDVDHAPAKPVSEPAAPAAAPRAEDPTAIPQPGARVCRSMHWDISVDEEGDAYNEMSYLGVVLPPESPAIWALPPAEVQSGHCGTFELVRDSRTSEGITLDQTLDQTVFRKIETKVVFANRPTALYPANLCLSNYDWNAYSMNMEEYRQKPGWREDGMDYVEKSIPESWDVFTLLIRFPEQMVFAKEPFFEIYGYSSGVEKREDQLSGQFQDCFYFSKVQKTAVLSVRYPPAFFSCRVSWLLGESWVGVTSSLVPKQRQRQRIFAQKLLRMRRTVDGATGGASQGGDKTAAEELNTSVNSVLASVAQYVEQGLDEPLDSDALELSLMVLDNERMEEPAPDARKLPVLRIVAGTHLQDTKYSGLALFVGDGNAGRAWKRRMARVFDRTEKDPKRHIYVPVSEHLRHQFLLSVPLIDPESAALVYGILNIGTFSEPQAELLRPLSAKEEIEKLTGFAQAFVLKRLLEYFKMESWQ